MGRRRTLVCSDNHGPDDDKPSRRIFMQAIRDLKPDSLWLLGDILDLESQNRHPPTGEDVPDLAEEYDWGNEFLDEVEDVRRRSKQRGPTDDEFFEGNHCQRIRKARVSWPSSIRSLIPDVPDALGLKRRGWGWVPIVRETRRDGDMGRVIEFQPVKRGKLFVFHGEFWGVTHAAKHATEFAVSGIYGHTHRCQTVAMTKPHPDTGENRLIHMTGLPCMRTLHASWKGQTKWQNWSNGFGCIEWDGDEAFVYPIVVREKRGAYGGYRWKG